MRAKKILLITIFSTQYFLLHAQYAWEQLSDFPGDARSACSAFSFEEYGVVGLGYDGTAFRRSCYAYHKTSGTWVAVSSLGGDIGEGLERNVAASFTIGTKGYVGTGQGGVAFLNDFWEYDATSDTWTQKANFAGSARRCATGFALEEKGYIGLGQDEDGYINDLWQYDPATNNWSAREDFPGTARRLAACFVIDDRAYVGTGDNGAFTNDFYTYDAGLDTWFLITEFEGSPRYSATAFSVLGKGYLVGGYDTTLTNRNDFWQYDPLLDYWLQMPDFPGSGRANAVSFTIDSAGFVGLGYDTTFFSDLWRWGDTSEVIEDTTDDTIIVVNDLPLQEILANIFPNPVTKFATVELQGNFSDGLPKFFVYDIAGNLVSVRTKIMSIQQEEVIVQIDAAELPQGNYFFTAEGKNFRVVKKLLKLAE